MSVEPLLPDVNPITIRNVRYAPLLPQNLLGVAMPVMLVVLLVLCTASSALELMIVGVAVVVLGGLGGWWLLVNFSPCPLGLKKLVLDKGVLYRVPGRGYPATMLLSITLLPDPHEDYVDWESPVRVYLVRIYPRLATRFEMPVSGGDAERLRLWALANKLEVDDQREPRDA